ncbi:MAG: DUF364 domain-containing protein [Candidatus Tritonobacter lacicola]|nr:DUF364 domain-containing protein [Candidatus Tritonobacter lacicola]
MGILSEIIGTVKEDAAVREIYVCAFDTAVLTRRWGLSSTFRDICGIKGGAWVSGCGTLLGKSALELARYAHSPKLLDSSVGMAALNSLLEVDDSSLVEVNAFEILREKGKGKEVAVVGRFPFLGKLEGIVKKLHVIHREPAKAREGMDEARRILPRVDVAAITGTSFLTKTVDELLSLCSNAYVIMLGPTTPLTPLLFDYGVDAVSGSLVKDSGKALPCIWQGSPFRKIDGLRLVTMLKP